MENSEKLAYQKSLLGRLDKNITESAIYEKALYGFSLARSAGFLAQNLVLLLFAEKERAQKPEFSKNLKMILNDISELLKKDAKNIADGIYPASVLRPESLFKSLKRYPEILIDSFQVKGRRSNKKTKDFNAEAEQYLNEVPDYFKRNFHFQTGGYLTGRSAELYEHQVEILFSGAADAMRRLLLPAMKQHFGGDGEGLHFLEVAAGTGRLSRFVKLAFPKAKLTVLDLSHPYLKKAQENLSEFSKVDFIQGDAAALPFKDQQFDAIFSCFLFHELPYEERRKVISESFRALKPNGFCGLVDSLQNEDRAEFEWALQQFPVDFHEPFYKNYLQNPMEGIFKDLGFENIETSVGFFSKAVSGRKRTQ